MKQTTLSELARLVEGVLVGNGDHVVTGVAPIQSAGFHDISFLDRLDRLQRLKKCEAVAVLVPAGLKTERFSTIEVENVLVAFEKIAQFFVLPHPEMVRHISEKAVLSESACVGKDVAVGPFAVIDDDVVLGDRVTIYPGVHLHAGVRVGNDTTIFSNAVLYRDSVIGCRCIIHANAVIGAFGFGYDSSKGVHKLSAQLGNVIIGSDVEIGSCTTVDRATYGSTIIGDGTKIDNFVMIAHNCKIGKNNMICAHTGIAGSTTTGDDVVMAGRVGIRDHVHIGDRSVIGAMSGIMANVPDDARIVGIPARPEKEEMRILAAVAKLPDMRREFRELQHDVQELKQKIDKIP